VFSIVPAQAADAGEVLTLQRAAFVTEAQLYSAPFLPALTQSLDEVAAEMADGLCLKAVEGHRIVGAGRARADLGSWHISRLSVAPDRQGRGIGTALLQALEAAAGDDITVFKLFTGARSDANLKLYGRQGYSQIWHEALKSGPGLIHLEKRR